MPQNPAKSSLSYLQLLKIARQIIATGRQKAKVLLEQMYHDLGGHIAEYELNGSDRAKYGEHVYERLSKALKIDIKTLYDAVRFFREFPILYARTELPWTAYRGLLKKRGQATFCLKN